MKKYNYFDDEADEIEEVKKSNSKKPGKIDLSTIIYKFKKIEATVHEEAEEDIEVVACRRRFASGVREDKGVQLLKDYGLQAQYL